MKDFHSLGDLTPEQFVIRAIERLRTPPYKGIHTVFSGFNEAFREFFPLIDPVEFTNRLAKAGKIVIRPVRKGVIIYKPCDVPGFLNTKDVIEKITKD